VVDLHSIIEAKKKRVDGSAPAEQVAAQGQSGIRLRGWQTRSFVFHLCRDGKLRLCVHK